MSSGDDSSCGSPIEEHKRDSPPPTHAMAGPSSNAVMDSSTATLAAQDPMQVEKALAALNEKQAAYEVAKLEPGEHPQTWSKLKRWAAVLTICMGALLGTCASSAVRRPKNLYIISADEQYIPAGCIRRDGHRERVQREQGGHHPRRISVRYGARAGAAHCW